MSKVVSSGHTNMKYVISRHACDFVLPYAPEFPELMAASIWTPVQGKQKKGTLAEP
jgi:hypothetical protein